MRPRSVLRPGRGASRPRYRSAWARRRACSVLNSFSGVPGVGSRCFQKASMKRSRSRSDLELQEDLPLHRGDDGRRPRPRARLIGRGELGLGALAGGGRRRRRRPRPAGRRSGSCSSPTRPEPGELRARRRVEDLMEEPRARGFIGQALDDGDDLVPVESLGPVGDLELDGAALQQDVGADPFEGPLDINRVVDVAVPVEVRRFDAEADLGVARRRGRERAERIVEGPLIEGVGDVDDVVDLDAAACARAR